MLQWQKCLRWCIFFYYRWRMDKTHFEITLLQLTLRITSIQRLPILIRNKELLNQLVSHIVINTHTPQTLISIIRIFCIILLVEWCDNRLYLWINADVNEVGVSFNIKYLQITSMKCIKVAILVRCKWF